MSFHDALENSVLNHVLGGPDYTRLATVWVGLSSTTPTDAGGSVTEPSGGAYARVSVTNNATNFPAASGGAKSNGTAITFPTASATWVAGANLTHAVVFDASTAGNAIMSGALGTPKPVVSGDTASFAIGQLQFTLD